MHSKKSMEITTIFKLILFTFSSILVLVPNANAEVKCGARWDGTPRCENWLGQEVDIHWGVDYRGNHIVEGDGFSKKCSTYIGGDYRCE